jgi:hypothetical protein
MDFDTVMFAMIFAGFALCAAYFWAVYVRWRNQRAAEQRRTVAFGQLYANWPRKQPPGELKVSTGSTIKRPQGRDAGKQRAEVAGSSERKPEKERVT